MPEYTVHLGCVLSIHGKSLRYAIPDELRKPSLGVTTSVVVRRRSSWRKNANSVFRFGAEQSKCEAQR
jgi:hypothetical protein